MSNINKSSFSRSYSPILITTALILATHCLQRTAVMCAVEWFDVKLGLHQGSALTPCLSAMVMNRMTDEIREEAPWTMMFADEIVICSESYNEETRKTD